MEKLASHGYIVFAVGHPYDDFAYIYPDGKITPYSKK
jgi:predicted dienelactone hydrolase